MTTADECEAITDRLTGLVLRRPVTRGWLLGFAAAFGLLMVLNFSIGWLLIAAWASGA